MNPIRAIINVAVCFIVFILSIWAFKGNNLILFSLIALLPLGIMISGRLDIILMTLIIANSMNLRLPFLPGQGDVHRILGVLLVAMIALNLIINKKRSKTPVEYKIFVVFFSVLALFLMYYRGTGFRAFGGNMSGGLRYVDLLLGLGFLYFLPNIYLTPKQWKNTIIISAFAGFLPALSEIVYFISNGKIWWQYYFIQAGNLLGVDNLAAQSDQGFRLRSFTSLSKAILILPFILSDYNKRPWLYFLCLPSAIILSSLSGYRSSVATIGLFVFLWMLIESIKNRKVHQFIIATLVASLFGYVLIFATFPFMPYPMQRALSFLPFMDYHLSSAISEASSTIDWRILIWKEALKEVPQYLIIGKGLAFSTHEAMSFEYMSWMFGGWHTVLRAIATVDYHSGPLSSLIVLGLPGTIGLILFFINILKQVKVEAFKRSQDRTLERIIQVYCINIFISIFSYLFVYGIAGPSIGNLCYLLAIGNSLFLLRQKHQDVHP